MRRAALDVFPRLGWVAEPTPISALSDLRDELGLAWLGAKRDDLAPELYGGSKVRKLDFALAAPPLASAREWISFGSIGSGHLVALTAAAERLERRLVAHCFFVPIGPSVEENLAFTASGPTELYYSRGRVQLAMRQLFRRARAQSAFVPPGATSAAAMLGMVRAGLELAEQMDAGELPELDRVYVPLGSGGVAAGLALGLALGGRRPALHAVAVVEHVFATEARLRRLLRAAREALAAGGITAPEHAPLVIDRRMLGAGYGRTTARSLRAVAQLRAHGIDLEPIYGGKAMAALLADAASGLRVLFYSTAHVGPLPRAADWEARLPAALRRDLRAGAGPRRGRRWIAAGAAAAGAVALTARLGFHDDVPGWEGHELFEWEGAVIVAAAEAILPDSPGGPIEGGVPLAAIAVNVDRYLVGLPRASRAEVHAMLALIEQATPLAGQLRRFTALDASARREALLDLAARGGDLALAVRGLRDLCYLGYYQDDRAWRALEYGGPWVPPARGGPSPYDALVAPEGARPPGRVAA